MESSCLRQLHYCRHSTDTDCWQTAQNRHLYTYAYHINGTLRPNPSSDQLHYRLSPFHNAALNGSSAMGLVSIFKKFNRFFVMTWQVLLSNVPQKLHSNNKGQQHSNPATALPNQAIVRAVRDIVIYPYFPSLERLASAHITNPEVVMFSSLVMETTESRSLAIAVLLHRGSTSNQDLHAGDLLLYRYGNERSIVSRQTFGQAI